MLGFFVFVYKYFKHQSKEDSSNEMDILKNFANNVDLFWWVTFFAVLSSAVPTIVKLISLVLVGSNDSIEEHRKELQKLKGELREINMMDEFAKHMKVQRKINKVTEIIASESNQKGIFKMKLKFISYVILYFITGSIMMYNTWTYKFTPLIILNKDVFYPFNNVLSFPTGVEGAIGIVPLVAMVSRASRNFFAFFQQNQFKK